MISEWMMSTPVLSIDQTGRMPRPFATDPGLCPIWIECMVPPVSTQASTPRTGRS